jgi:hypothetical protein
MIDGPDPIGVHVAAPGAVIEHRIVGPAVPQTLDHGEKFLGALVAVGMTDLLAIAERDWLHRGTVVVADNVGFPGAPKYRAYMRQQQGRLWKTTEHRTHVEYQSLIPDLVLESDYLG